MRAFLAIARNEIAQLYRDKLYLFLLTVGAAGLRRLIDLSLKI